MASVLQTLLRVTNFRSPLLRTLVPTAVAAFALQAAVAVPSVLAQSERFFDLSGSATVLAASALSLYLPALRARAAGHLDRLPSLWAALRGLGAGAGVGKTAGIGSGWWNWRQLVATALTMVWTMRLGIFLFRRVTAADGRDSRFDQFRTKPLAFASCFLAQGAWVSLTLAPVAAMNAVAPSAALAAAGTLTLTDVVGLGVWVGGFVFEAVADAQKSRWAEEKKRKLHDEDFLTRGLFSVRTALTVETRASRFPNYFGEISLWTGLAIFVSGSLARLPAQLSLGLGGGAAGILTTTALSFVSPAFSAFLLTRVSGIPMSEGKYDKRYGGRRDYEEWKRTVPRLVPRLW